MKPLRFCHVTTFYPPYNFGGDGIGVQRLCRALVRAGHEVTLVHDADAYRALRRAPPPPAEPEPEGLEVVRLESGAPRLASMLTQQTGRPVVHRRQLAALLGEREWDVINFHNVSLIGGPGILGLGRALKLYMAHEHWLVCPSHVLWRHDREPCTGRECLRCVLHFHRPPQAWRYTAAIQRAGRHVDRFIAMSEFSRAKHREFGFPFEMEVLPYFLPDPEPGAEPPVRAAGGPRFHPRPYFLYVGRLERIKGLDDVIPLFRGFEEADLLVAGEGEHGARLRELAAGSPRVRFLGRLSDADLAQAYRGAEALIVPSAGFETFGIILIEAFRAGTPVIARRIGPFPEIVEQAGSGELFSTPDELAGAMRRLLRDPGLRERHARRGYQAWLERWTESAVLPRYLDIVARAAERKAAAELRKL
ncbi:MAG TPA: glycosyltransferase family 4 protein [Planctomycetota bacterium]|nr:glycosyltransferase family 4 protein [Planctomycetota bacterium]